MEKLGRSCPRARGPLVENATPRPVRYIYHRRWVHAGWSGHHSGRSAPVELLRSEITPNARVACHWQVVDSPISDMTLTLQHPVIEELPRQGLI
jgi:hypothetical protein